ncbi:dihydrofolate reductase [Virgibacillus halodenitrificans]|uniref:Dihydrofolate reductase n=1 Tax=Virgibacillus halodenitrificans TaxID=1482 RepID=A0AAC9IZ30_VIRHA|nr:dihydrofolate reductase [Virgibacillus halodenitrificans]APC48486.1 dihydrofolate reductase [Virgibacillus halodenitrificans]MBD1222557.1 dihydrofolate reductase [Virgibacillus halodenitrificans]MYL58639.1 dihydrofolate reductase [Virgibacillus halodenitrificans]
MISLLVAMDKNHVIGHNNGMPWHLPKDLRFFKEKTTGQTIIMGRKTYDSMGGSLPNRKNVVISRNTNLKDQVEVIHDLETVEEWNRQYPEQEFFVIGGGNIFNQALPFADRMYITWIDEEFEGDTYFPAFSDEEWNLTSKTKGEKNETNPYDYYFLQYDRK